MHCTVEPRYNEDLETMKISLYQGKKKRKKKSWDQQNYLVIRGFCYIRPLYNEVPLYILTTTHAYANNKSEYFYFLFTFSLLS